MTDSNPAVVPKEAFQNALDKTIGVLKTLKELTTDYYNLRDFPKTAIFMELDEDKKMMNFIDAMGHIMHILKHEIDNYDDISVLSDEERMQQATEKHEREEIYNKITKKVALGRLAESIFGVGERPVVIEIPPNKNMLLGAMEALQDCL